MPSDIFHRYINVLDDTLFRKLSNRLGKSKCWEFANTSGNVPFEKDGFHFWYNDLREENEYFNEVFDRICHITDKKFSLHKVSANGQTHGQPGHLHIDLDSPNGYTFLLYMNSYWHLEWGGSTILYDHETDNVEQILPIPNTGILFKGNLLHYGSEPSRHCKVLRMSVAFKLLEAAS